MRLRNIGKMNYNNDGNRTFYESIMNRFVLTALKYLSHNDQNFIIIGENAVGYHSRPFANKIIRILTDNKDRKFKYFPNNVFKKYNIILEVNHYSDIGLSKDQYIKGFKDAYISDGFRIASPSFLIYILLKKNDEFYMEYVERLINSNRVINSNDLYELKYYFEELSSDMKFIEN